MDSEALERETRSGTGPPPAVAAGRTRSVGSGRRPRLLGAAGGPLALGELAAFVAAAPLLVFPNRYSVLALMLLPAVWLARLVVQRRGPYATPASVALCGLLLATSLSLYPSIDLALSRPKHHGLVLGLFLFALLVQHGRTPLWRAGLGLSLAVGGTLVAGLALVGTNWSLSKWAFLDAVYDRLPRLVTRVQSSLGTIDGGFSPNEVGGTLALLVPCSVALALFGTRWLTRALLWAAVAFMLGVLLLTASRSALVGVALALGALGMARWPRLLFALPVVLLATVALTAWIGPARLAQTYLSMEAATSLTMEGRVEIWTRALFAIRDFPLTGVGLNTFPVVNALLYPSTLLGTEKLVPHAHSLLLQVAVDLGLPGLASFLGLVVQAVFALERARRGFRGWERGLAAGLAAGLVAHLVFGLTDAVALGAKPSVFLWLVLGGAVALAALTPGSSGGVSGAAPGAAVASPPASTAGALGAGKADRVVAWLAWALFTLTCALGVLIAG